MLAAAHHRMGQSARPPRTKEITSFHFVSLASAPANLLRTCYRIFALSVPRGTASAIGSPDGISTPPLVTRDAIVDDLSAEVECVKLAALSHTPRVAGQTSSEVRRRTDDLNDTCSTVDRFIRYRLPGSATGMSNSPAPWPISGRSAFRLALRLAGKIKRLNGKVSP